MASQRQSSFYTQSNAGLPAPTHICLFALLIITLGLLPSDAHTSHILGAHLSWQAADSLGTGPDSLKVVFKFVVALELDPFLEIVGEGGEFDDPRGDLRIDFGDGLSGPIGHYRIDTINRLDKVAICTAIEDTLEHAYPARQGPTGPWQARVSGCCRFNGLANVVLNTDLLVRTSVNLDQVRQSLQIDPAFSFFVRLASNNRRTFAVPLIIPDGRTVTAVLDSTRETGITGQPGFLESLLVENDTLLIETNEILENVGSLWATQVVLQEFGQTDVNEDTLLTKTTLDFALKIDSQPELEILSQTIVCGSTVTIQAGQELTFQVWAFDDDPTDSLTFEFLGELPGNATLDPVLPLTGFIDDTTRFSWTPILADPRERVLTFLVSDRGGARDTCSLTVRVTVPDAPVCDPPNRTFTIKPGNELAFRITVTDPQPQDTIVLEELRRPSSSFFNPELPISGNPVSTDFLWTPTIEDTGTHVIELVATDPVGLQDTCRYEIVVPDTSIACDIRIVSPANGSEICADSISVSGNIEVTGDMVSSIVCTVNGTLATVDEDSFLIRIPLRPGENRIVALCNVVGQQGGRTSCVDSVLVDRLPAPMLACEVKFTNPASDTTVCGDSLMVAGMLTVDDASPTAAVSCEVNGIPASILDSMFMVTVPLSPGLNRLIASCTVVDSCGSNIIEASCRDSVEVIRTDSALVCSIDIIQPAEGAIVCGDSMLVTAAVNVSGGTAPISKSYEINGIPAFESGGMIAAQVPLLPEKNDIVVTGTVSDDCGARVTCRDSVSVFNDAVPPGCVFSAGDNFVAGTFMDAHSGIAAIVPINLRNAELFLDPENFSPGAKSVNFRLEAIDPGRAMGFSIDVIDTCGNVFNCDPVYVNLSADADSRHLEVSFPDRDRYFQLTNYGLERIEASLNGHSFVLSHDGRENEAYFLPREGRVTIDLSEELSIGENFLTLTFAGPRGSYAELLLLDRIDYEPDIVLRFLQVPEVYRLAQNFPNPFNPSTAIAFDIPAGEGSDVHVRLRVFNVLGELIRVLIDETRPSGRHRIEWNARDQNGQLVSSGVYIYVLDAGSFHQANRMLLLK